MVDHALIVKRQPQENWVEEQIELPFDVLEVIQTQAQELNLTLDEYINVILRERIFDLMYKTKNAIFDTDAQLLSEDEFSAMLEDLPLFIHSDKGGGVIVSVEDYNAMKGIECLKDS